MEQRSIGAALKDAQINPNEQEYARDMVHNIATITMTRAFTSLFGSELDKTTLTHPNHRSLAAFVTRVSVPEQVVVCEVVTVENLVEVDLLNTHYRVI